MSKFDSIVNELMAGNTVAIPIEAKEAVAGVRSAYYRQRTKLRSMGFKDNKQLHVVTTDTQIIFNVVKPAKLTFTVVSPSTGGNNETSSAIQGALAQD